MRKLSTDLIKSGSFTGSFSGSVTGLINSASYALTASTVLNAFSLTTGSTYSITASWSNYSISSSFSNTSTSSSYANTASNLSPVAQDLIPSVDSLYNLGSITNKWKDLYVSTGSIYIGNVSLNTSGSTLFANVQPIVTLNTASGQIEVSGITASLSASFATNAGTINNTSSNIFATTGSNTFNGTQTVQGDVRVVGNLIAQQYVISSSVSYFTSSNFDGSTKFGDSDLDTHQFTGSLRSPNITGSLLGTASIALIALTSSYINVATNAISSSFANTASISISSSFASTASYNLNSISSSYSLNSVSSSYSNVANTATSAISSSYATTAGTATSATSANSATSASYALTASFALNASGGGGGSGTVSGSANYIAKFTSGSSVGNSVIYETGSNIGIGTINPNAKLNINSSGSLVSGSVVFSVEGTQGSLFSVDDSLSGSLMSVNDISGLPILEVFSDDRLVVGTYNANTLVVTGSRVGIGTSVPVAKLQVSGNISGSSFTSSVSNGVGFLGTSSFAVTASFSLTASNVVTASYALNALTASFALNASGGGGGSGTVTGSVNYISKFTSTTSVGNSVIYETGSNIGIGTTNPNSKLNINSSGSLASGSVVFSVEGTQGSLFSVDDSLSGSLMSVNDISGLPILEVFSDDRLVVGTYNSNALVVTGSRVGIGTNNPVAKLQVNGNISGSSFTGSVFGTSSWATNALSASFAPGGGTTLTTGSTYPITSSWATTSSNIIGGTTNYIPLWSTNTSLGNSVLYQNSSNVGIGTTSPTYKLDVIGAVKSTIDNSFSFASNRSAITVWNGLGFLTNNVSKWFVGLRETSDDNLRWYNFTNSTERMVLTETGNLGIGTSTPASILHLQSSAATTLLRIDNTNNANDAAILLTDGTNPTGEGFRITYDSSVGDTYFNNIFTSSIQAFNFQKGNFGSGTSLLTILNSGNVGIGTTSPAYKLDVNGSASFADNVIITKNQNALTRLIVSNTTSNSSSYVETAFVNDVASGAGAVGRYGSTTTTYKIVTANNQFLYNGATSGDIAILNDFASGSIKMSTGGSSNVQFIISSSGNVGIGTTSPVAKLQVNGNISGSSFTGSVFGTSSWANNATTASFASTASYNLNSISSSYALTASFALNASGGGGGSISYITGSPVVGQYIVVSGSSTTQYTLTQSVSNPEHLLVSVNGVVQNYSSSYTVTGSTINFYQPYSDGDEIDVRFLNGGTTVQTGSIAGQTILYNFSSSQESTLTGLNLTGNKWGVNVIEEWNSGSGDIYFNSCSLLLHFDSLNSSGSFIDNSSNNFAITSSGDAKLSTSQYKFGGASAYFDGANDYLLIQDNNAFELGNSDFTIETFVYFVTLPSTNGYQSTIISKWSSSNNSYEIYLYNNAGTYQLYLTYSTNGTTSTNLGVNWTPNIGQWYHIACVRSSTNVYFWVNGVQQGTTQSISGTLYNGTAQLEIGGFGLGSANTVLNGYLDELRITKGVARYTASFTPSSFAFPNSAAQIATKYIGLVGGLNDTNVDYGIEKLSDTSLKIKKLTDTQQPSGSFLSSSVDRVYVNVLNYDNVSISGSISNAVTASYAVTASHAVTSAPRTAIYRYGTTSVVNPGSYANTIVKYDTAVTDSTGWYNNTNGRFTPTVAGWYQVSAGARVYGGSSAAEGYLGLFKNGTQIAVVGGIGIVFGLIPLLVYFNGSTDYIEIYSNMNASITNVQNSATTPFTMVYMTP